MRGVILDKYGVPKLSRTDIEVRVEGFLRFFAPECLLEPRCTPVAGITKTLAEKYGLRLVFGADLGVRDGRKIRGTYDCSNRTISIDASMTNDGPRFNFTLAHEIGHFVMHRNLTPKMIGALGGVTIHDGDRDLVLDQLETDNPRSWIEWQANKFASSLLLPRNTVPNFIKTWQRKAGITRNIGKLYLDRQAANYSDFKAILKEMVLIYQTSAAAIRIRLREMNILEESTNFLPGPEGGPLHVGSAIVKVLDNLEAIWKAEKREG